MTRYQQPAAGVGGCVPSYSRYAERELRGVSRVRRRQAQLSSTTAKTAAMWYQWQGNRDDALGGDSHTPPPGWRALLRELESRPCGTPRMIPHIRLGSYRGPGDVVEDQGGPTGLGPPPPRRVCYT